MIAAIIERLKAEASPPFSIVEGSADLAALGSAQPNAMPAAYVFVAEEAAEENSRVNAVLQRMEVDVSVVVITSNVSDAQGAAASVEIEGLKKAVRRALVGWQPEGAEDVITNVGSRLVRVRDSTVWVEMTFATATYEEG